jgi:hypothetical protein
MLEISALSRVRGVPDSDSSSMSDGGAALSSLSDCGSYQYTASTTSAHSHPNDLQVEEPWRAESRGSYRHSEPDSSTPPRAAPVGNPLFVAQAIIWGFPQEPEHTHCENCGTAGHHSAQCSRSCRICAGYSHQTLACWVNSLQCANCGQNQHHFVDCSSPCNRCGDAGHKAPYCLPCMQ